MKLKIAQDAETTAEVVFDTLTDFRRIERDIRERGFNISRRGQWQSPAQGAEWTGRGDIRGKTRRFDAKIADWDPSRRFGVEAKIGGLRIVQELQLIALGDAVTRVNVVVDLRPDTLSARLLVQSLKLARGRVLDRMQRWLAAELRRAEQRG